MTYEVPTDERAFLKVTEAFPMEPLWPAQLKETATVKAVRANKREFMRIPLSEEESEG
ncbi:hypothetical protein [Streptomyces arboris]|uniref:hypothetical protein n=1 Tax=Streptomyces arboris TaxID=2600619 RepID=UPI003BF59AAB